MTRIFKDKEFCAVNNIFFDIFKGEIFGLLGPNGAGKSTTIKILSTMLAPTVGEAKILNYDTFKEAKLVRKHINFVFGGERGLYWRLTGEENLIYFSDIYKISIKEQTKLIPKLLEMVGLYEFKDRRVESYSKGMKQRLQIARSLLNDPEIIFFDESSIGLDPEGANKLRDVIKELSYRGKTILLTTHYMSEAQELCDRIAIINHGEIITVGTVEELENKIPRERVEEIIK
ncbi:ABC transporter ATP-binding protein [Facklamia sp. P13064]|uniref:ABC transporter ATP-binding protein n=1 Tax=Facklamia sp. P13064 TaxID=3421953 RepID=UPI003D172700